MSAAGAGEQKKEKKNPGFEKSLERLEKLVDQMESGELTLEQMIGHFEEGQSLVKVCSRKLNEVERKIELLVKQGDKVKAEPFDDSAQSTQSDDGQVDSSDELF